MSAFSASIQNPEAFEHLKQARRQLSHSVELMRSKVQEAVRDATRNAMRNAKLEEEVSVADWSLTISS